MNGILAPTTTSELDIAMQPYIAAGTYSEEELEKIRKRLANKKNSYEFSWGEQPEPKEEKSFLLHDTPPTVTANVGDKIEISPDGGSALTKQEGGKVTVSPEHIATTYNIPEDEQRFYDYEITDELENSKVKITKKNLSDEEYRNVFWENIGSKPLGAYQEKQLKVAKAMIKNPKLTANNFTGVEKDLFENFKKELGGKNMSDLIDAQGYPTQFLQQILSNQQNQFIGSDKIQSLYQDFQKSNDGSITLADHEGVELGEISYDDTPAIPKITMEHVELKKHYDKSLNVEKYLSGESGQSKFYEELKNIGYTVSNQGTSFGDYLGQDEIYIYKTNGDDRPESEGGTGLTLRLPTTASTPGANPMFDTGMESRFVEKWEDTLKTLNAHINHHGVTLNEEEKKIQAEKKRVEIDIIARDLAIVSNPDLTEEERKKEKTKLPMFATPGGFGDKDIGFEGFSLNKRQKVVANILADLPDKMITVIKENLLKEGKIEKNDLSSTLEDLTDKYENIMVGFDWQNLINQDSHKFFGSTVKEELLKFYKQVLGDSILSERQIEDSLDNAITEFVKQQTNKIDQANYVTIDAEMKFDGTNANEIALKRVKKVIANIDTTTDHGKAKKELALLAEQFDAVYVENEENPSAESQAKLIAIRKKMEDFRSESFPTGIIAALFSRYGKTKGYYFIDKDGNHVEEDNYDPFTGHVVDQRTVDFNIMLIENNLNEDVITEETEDLSGILTIAEYDEIYGNQTTEESKVHKDKITRYKKFRNYRENLSVQLWHKNNMRKKRADFVINDWLAYNVLKKLAKTDEYAGRIVFKGDNDNGWIVETDLGILEEHYNSIIGSDGVSFLGDWSTAEHKKYAKENFKESPTGYFAPLNEDKFNKEFSFWEGVIPYVPGTGGEAKETAFTNMIKNNRQDYINLVDQLNVVDMLMLERTDPTSLTDEFKEKLYDVLDHTGVKIASAFGAEYVDPEDRNYQGNYKGEVGISNRSRMDIFQTVVDDAGITTSDVQKEQMRRSALYSAWEGTIDFVPVVLEFAAAELVLGALEVVTFGGATPVVAAAQHSLFAKLASRILSVANKGKKVSVFKPAANLGKALPGAAKRAAWYEKHMATSLKYRTANGIRMSEKQIKRIEKATKTRRGTKAFERELSLGDRKWKGLGLKRKRWGGDSSASRSYLQTGIRHGYHGLREELKMAMVFDEYYHVGGGFAFYGVGKLLSKVPFKFTESVTGMAPKTRPKLRSGRTGGKKQWTSPKNLTLENYSNILNSGLTVGRSGLAGMISAPTAMAFEQFLADAQGGKTFDFLKDMYPELSSTTALTDFFMFSMLGIKGLWGPKGTGLKTVRQLERLERMSEIQMNRAHREGFNDKAEKWTSEKLKDKFQKYSELHSAVKSKTDVLREAEKWLSPKYAKKHSEKIFAPLKKTLENATGEKMETVFVNTVEDLQKNKGQVATVLGDGAAGAHYNKSTKKWEFIIDVSKTTPGKIPHEIQHFMDRVVLENDPIAARRMVEIITEAMGGSTFWSIPKTKIVEGKEVFVYDANGKMQYSDLTIKQMVEQFYAGKSGHEMDLEFLGWTTEVLAETKNFHKFTKGGGENTWTKLEKSIGEWESTMTLGKSVGIGKKKWDVRLMPKSTKQQVINFFAEMAQASKRGKTSGKHIDLYKKLGKALTYDQPNGFGGLPYKGGVSMKSLFLREQKMAIMELKDKLNKAVVEELKIATEEQKVKRREAYKSDLKDINKAISDLDKAIIESEKDFKFEKDIERIYTSAKTKDQAAWEIAEQYDPRKSDSAGAKRIERELTKERINKKTGQKARPYSSLPDYNIYRDNIIDEITTGTEKKGEKRSVRQMVLDYDPNNKLGPNGETVPLSGYIGILLSKRGLSEQVEKFIKKGVGFKPGTEQGEFVPGGVEPSVLEGEILRGKEDLSIYEGTDLYTWASDIQTRKIGMILKTKPGEVDAVREKIQDIDINNASVQTIENLLPGFTKQLFGKGPLEKAQFITENVETVKNMFFKGTMEMSGKLGGKIGAIARKANKKKGIKKGDIVAAEGATTKLPGSILERVFTAGERAGFAKTGQAGGNPQQILDKMSNAEFLERIGIEIIDNKTSIISERLRREALEKYGKKSEQYKIAHKEYRNVTETLIPQIEGVFGRVKSVQIIGDLANQPGAAAQLGIKHSLLQFNQLLKAGFSDMMLSIDANKLFDDIYKLEHVDAKTLTDLFDTYALSKKDRKRLVTLFDGIYKTIRDRQAQPDYKLFMEFEAERQGTTVEALEKLAITEAKDWKKELENTGIEYLGKKKRQESIDYQSLKKAFDIKYIKSFGRWEDLPVWVQDRIMDSVGYGEWKDLDGNRMQKNLELPPVKHALTAKEKREFIKQVKKGFTPEDVTTELSENVRRENNLNAIEHYYGKDVLKGKKLTAKELKSLENVYFPTNMGTVKKNIAEVHERLRIDTKEMTEADAWNYIQEAANIASGGKDYLTVLEANKGQARKEFDILNKLIKSGEIKDEQGVVDYLIAQTNRSSGWLKGLYTITSISKIRSEPTENDGWTGFHAEHEQMLFKTASAFYKIAKNTSGKKYTSARDALVERMEQAVIAKDLQLHNDSGKMSGPSGLPPGIPHHFGAYAKLIFMTKPEVAENMYYIPASLKAGKPVTIAEYVKSTIAKGELLKLLESVPNKSISHERMKYEIENKVSIDQLQKTLVKQLNQATGMQHSKDMSGKEARKKIETVDAAIRKGRKKDKEKRGMSTFDFDETVGVSENYIIATKGKETKRIASHEWPVIGEQLRREGWKMDFTDFNKITKGKPGPLMEKLKNQIKKFGSENVFILTARDHKSAKAIHEWLKTQGVKIPLKNITGLGNSTGEAKAMWMLEKFAEGYNDMYFVDDAMSNVKAVKEVLAQLDVKSKVQQAIMKSVDIDTEFNKILEKVKGIPTKARVQGATAKIEGAKKGKWSWIIPPSAADFELLTSYTMAGKGKEGEAHQKWWDKHLFKPFARGINDINNAKQTVTNDYRALRKSRPGVRKMLMKNVSGTRYTYDAAIRVHRWTEAGYEVPGLSKTDLKKLNDAVNKNSGLKLYSEQLAAISKLKEGWVRPSEHWLTENIAADLNNINIKVNRKKYLAEWIENKNIVFSKVNLNKIEYLYGSHHREALEDMLYRMEHGTNRPTGKNVHTNRFMNWTNNSVGAIMFLNMRSASLQLLSSVNYINWAENNPAKAALAFANQPQYWKDFSTIFNSNMLKQRRAGLKMNVNEAEIAAAVEGSSNKAQAALSWLLKKGFTPTQIADSFAIASGGATFYRNRIKMYEKQGLKTKDAEKKAWVDFQEIAEKTQQSARPDLISQQQASPLGRLILAFANTPMQYARIMKKSAMDLAAGRGSAKSHISRITYYGAIQSMIFASLQSGMFAMLFDDELDEGFIDKKQERIYHTMADSLLRGVGVTGAIIAAIKNSIRSFMREDKKDYNADYMNVVVEMLNVSPPIGSKARKMKSALDTRKWNKDVMKEMGMNIENPAFHAIASVISATTNVPLDRMILKNDNLRGAINTQNATWQRIAMFMGYSRWNLGMDKPIAVQQAKDTIKKKKKDKAKLIQDEKKEEARVELQNKINDQVEQEKILQKQGKLEDPKCSFSSTKGARCKKSVTNAGDRCTIHEIVEQNETGKKVQCTKIKTNGNQCKMQTSNKSNLCYYHD